MNVCECVLATGSPDPVFEFRGSAPGSANNHCNIKVKQKSYFHSDYFFGLIFSFFWREQTSFVVFACAMCMKFWTNCIWQCHFKNLQSKLQVCFHKDRLPLRLKQDFCWRGFVFDYFCNFPKLMTWHLHSRYAAIHRLCGGDAEEPGTVHLSLILLYTTLWVFSCRGRICWNCAQLFSFIEVAEFRKSKVMNHANIQTSKRCYIYSFTSK